VWFAKGTKYFFAWYLQVFLLVLLSLEYVTEMEGKGKNFGRHVQTTSHSLYPPCRSACHSEFLHDLQARTRTQHAAGFSPQTPYLQHIRLNQSLPVKGCILRRHSAYETPLRLSPSRSFSIHPAIISFAFSPSASIMKTFPKGKKNPPAKKRRQKLIPNPTRKLKSKREEEEVINTRKKHPS
jgi:hypothetical protein